MATPPAGPLILLVDDYVDGREMYAEYLTFRGYRVVTADSGVDAVRVATLPDRPSLILMDIRMPNLDGTAAMKVLRQDRGFASVPIVALTAQALEDERASALLAGFDGVIAKPCFPDELVERIQHYLNLTVSPQGN
jgi:two-component system cell cycle response regulator DivK